MSTVVGEPVFVESAVRDLSKTDADLPTSSVTFAELVTSQTTLKAETAEDEIEGKGGCRWKTLLFVGTVALIIELINSSIVVYDIAIQHNEVLSFSLFRKLKVLPLLNLVFCFVGIVVACSRKGIPTGNICGICPGCHCVPWSLTILGILRLPEMIIIVIQYLNTRSRGDDSDAAFEWTLIAIGFLYAIILRAFGFFWLRRSRKQKGYWCYNSAVQEDEDEGTITRARSGKATFSVTVTLALKKLPVEDFFESVL